MSISAARVWLVVLLAASFAAQAEEPGSGPWEKGSLSIGGFISTTNSEFQLNSETLGAGAVVDMEDALDLDSDVTTYRIDGFYRFGSTRRHQVEAHYYRSDREGSRILGEDLQIGDTVFPTGTGVQTELDLWFLNVNYSYAFLQDDRVRLAAAAGLHVTGIKFDISAPGFGLQEAEDVTAPLPVLGLRADFVLTERWRMWAGTDVFYLSYDEFRGALLDASIAVEYLPFKHVGFGLGLNTVRYTLEAEGDGALCDIDGKLKYDFTGALLYVKLFF
jgi:hypothetical protein